MQARISGILGAALAVGLYLGAPSSALALECESGFCGTPNVSGGGCGCGCGCSVLVAMTDLGDTYQFADDWDGDGVEDDFDACPFIADVDQLDGDGDGAGDACDVCPGTFDAEQLDLDLDGLGDACDDDMDNDGLPNGSDNCPGVPNPAQTRSSTISNLGDACNDDDDGDGILDVDDPCPLLAGISDTSAAGCEGDEDGDGVPDQLDICVGFYNPVQGNGFQLDTDGDGLGDACDSDDDDDGYLDYKDNCGTVANPSQLDLDRDGLGDNGTWGNIDTPESCDDRECYEVGDGPCLDPTSPFQARITLNSPPLEKLVTGRTIVVPLFTNRLNQLHRWTARFQKVPDGSNASLFHAKGSSATLLDGPQVASCMRQAGDGSCSELNAISFEADEPGEYVVQVNVELPRGDTRFPGQTTATSTYAITVGGEPQGGGCNAAGASSLLVVALGSLGALLRRRRR